VGAGAGELAAVDNQVLLTDRTILKPAFEDLARALAAFDTSYREFLTVCVLAQTSIRSRVGAARTRRRCSRAYGGERRLTATWARSGTTSPRRDSSSIHST
jgi:hypothetical protein